MKKILIIVSLVSSMYVNAQWSELGGVNGLSANGFIFSICTNALGNVYATGEFTNSSGNRYVAKWNGTAWSELGGLNGLSANSAIFSIYTDALGNVYAGGDFTNDSGKRYVAKWNGTVWNELGGLNGLSANGRIYSILSDVSGNIYATGEFTNSSNNFYVAKWNGTSWSELGGLNGLSPNNDAVSMCSDASGNIYASGFFTNSSGKAYVAKWDGTTWSELGGLNGLSAIGSIPSIFSDVLGNIYASVTSTYGVSNVAKWNGNTWSVLGGLNGLSANASSYSICTDGMGNIYTAGDFTNGSSWANGNKYVAKWDGISWSELGVGGLNGLTGYSRINSICTDALGNIYAAGLFVNSSGNRYVAKYTQTLPLKLLSFTVQEKNNNVLLNWQTANEVNVSHINIQRSTNNNEFITIGKVNASCCAYSYLDNSPQSTVNSKLYYRLETVDKDGSKTYSTIQQITIKPQTPNSVSIYPNPAKTFATIECKGAKEISVIDYLGKTIKQINNPTQQQTINTKQLPKGINVVKVIMNNGEVKTEKLVVE